MWEECPELERNIILLLHKKSSSITEISKKLKRAKPTISKTVERMENYNLLEKTHQYVEDARKIKISLNKKRIKIEKSHSFYLTYYLLIAFSLIFSGIISYFLKEVIFLMGSLFISLLLFLRMAYEIYLKEDKVVVYKNPKLVKKVNKKEEEKNEESC